MQTGKISEELISTFEKDGSPLMGHPIKNLKLNKAFQLVVWEWFIVRCWKQYSK